MERGEHRRRYPIGPIVPAPLIAPGINTTFAEDAAGFELLIGWATDGHISTKAASNIADANAGPSLFIVLLR
jgi:hypothetical protein